MKYLLLLVFSAYIFVGCSEHPPETSSLEPTTQSTVARFGIGSTREEVRTALGPPQGRTEETEEEYEIWDYSNPHEPDYSWVGFADGTVKAYKNINPQLVR